MHISYAPFNFYLYGFQKLLLGGDKRGGRERPQGCLQSETGGGGAEDKMRENNLFRHAHGGGADRGE